ncbi:hypothetical protein SteCoe_12935 [Stentor coeruleus]|uniref:Aquaporin n=1 Tax=Stentor coeruleus TaxID=5963 RepID=A0A1R2C9J1_9CILI|nr:hypothetical protein SteCoe_12935 [Stentor coeruleus]
MYRRLFAEAVGVYILLFAVGVSDGEPFAVGGTLWCLMILTGFTSNAVFNPAISISFMQKAYYDKKLNEAYIIEYSLYILVQFVSAFLGALTAWAVLEHTVHFKVMDGYQEAETFYAEVIYTSMIACNAHMMGRLTDNPIIGGGVVAMTVTAGDWAIGKISGGCFNPAVAFAINLVAYIKTGKYMGDTWIYFFAPVIGAMIGTALSQFFGGELDRLRQEKEQPNDEEEVTINLSE